MRKVLTLISSPDNLNCVFLRMSSPLHVIPVSLLVLRSYVDILLGWDVFGGFGLGTGVQKQRVLLAFFVKTDLYLKKNVGIFVLNG